LLSANRYIDENVAVLMFGGNVDNQMLETVQSLSVQIYTTLAYLEG